jgi:hypothetical protein
VGVVVGGGGGGPAKLHTKHSISGSLVHSKQARRAGRGLWLWVVGWLWWWLGTATGVGGVSHRPLEAGSLLPVAVQAEYPLQLNTVLYLPIPTSRVSIYLSNYSNFPTLLLLLQQQHQPITLQPALFGRFFALPHPPLPSLHKPVSRQSTRGFKPAPSLRPIIGARAALKRGSISLS